ncbi:GNAT family N-acetyltransferase [Anaerocolumna chitinilytica]|uniref:N-acetyltransferase domain-containing protein n=1 Tax=Anaerocolumna chitinilytica TaxID=1727145 RepID=A0A7I8DJT0_9FIRM|nr:GNAT family N-acetyltransferase [Anaerocolumna chitinilytica]BCJ98713.1 hypothetical protein bsdcttw_17540 [Anaerocolumna chitinilytica]
MELKKVEIRPYSDIDMANFIRMFCSYFRTDFKYDISDKKSEELCNKIADSVMTGVTALDMLAVNGELVGFISYQVDSQKSDWCEREGWGFIREMYISHNMRRKGLGSILVDHAEMMLYDKGTKHIYLTSDEAGEFWRSCGYTETKSLSTINHDPIYEK